MLGSGSKPIRAANCLRFCLNPFCCVATLHFRTEHFVLPFIMTTLSVMPKNFISYNDK